MNKKFIISLGLVMAFSATITSYAAENTTIYTDSLGRMHFLGRDAANNVNSKANYVNSESQELTRKLYEQATSESSIDTDYNQHPLKNYSNTFPSSRYSEVKLWKPVDEETAKSERLKSAKTITETSKGQTDYSGIGSTNLDNPYADKKETVEAVKKIHWWNKKSKKNK